MLYRLTAVEKVYYNNAKYSFINKNLEPLQNRYLCALKKLRWHYLENWGWMKICWKQ